MSDVWDMPIKDVVDLAFELDNMRDFDADPRPYEEIFSWKEKAEKYDGIQECVPFVQHLLFEQVVLEYKTMQDKLEAIEKHSHDAPTYGLNFIDTYEKLAIANADWHLKLLKVLSSEFKGRNT